MPFIGQEPAAGSFKILDAITTSATATYALTYNSVAFFPASERNLIVSLNGVTQAPGTAYTITGSNITFASALDSADIIDYILVLGDVLSVGTPTDGTVGASQLASTIDLSSKTVTFADNQISGNKVDGGTISNFTSTGIDDNATSTALTLDSDENATFANNVLIGTDSGDSFNSNSLLRIQRPTGAAYIQVKTANTQTGGLLFGDTADDFVGGFFYQNNDNALTVYTNNAEAMRIDSSGDIGINRTSPNLHGWAKAVTLNTATNAGYELGQSGTKYGAFALQGDGRVQLTNFTSNPLTFQTDNTERMRIDSAGNVLVGKTAAGLTTAGSEVTSASLLQSASSTSTNLATNSGGVINLCNISATDGNFSNIGGYNSNGLVVAQMNFINLSHSSRTGAITFTTHDGSSFNEKMRIGSSGNVQLGTSSGTYSESLLSAIRNGNAIEWGHTNTAGYGSTIGANVGSGAPFIGLSVGAGTNNNTFRTNGIAGSLITTDNAGALIFARVTTASADNQSSTESMRIASDGRLQFNTVGASDTNNSIFAHTNNYLYVEGGSVGLVLADNAANSNRILIKDGNTMEFQTNGSERMRILSGGGITFNGDTATANALDDYEEGTWTPAYGVSTGSFGSITYSLQSGYYTKVGDVVTAHGRLDSSSMSIGSASNYLFITGFPYASASGAYQSGVISYSYGYTSVWANSIAFQGSTSYVYLFSIDDGANSHTIGPSNLGTGQTYLYFSITYKAA